MRITRKTVVRRSSFVHDMEDDFALRYVRIYPGVNSRAELVTLAQRRFAPLARGLHLLKNIKFCYPRHFFLHSTFYPRPSTISQTRNNGVNLIFQPPYSPHFNTCEFCFRNMKMYLRKNEQFAINFTEIAINYLII